MVSDRFMICGADSCSAPVCVLLSICILAIALNAQKNVLFLPCACPLRVSCFHVAYPTASRLAKKRTRSSTLEAIAYVESFCHTNLGKSTSLLVSVCTCKIQYRFLTTYQISQRCLLLGIHMTRYSLLISLACPVCMHSMVSRSYYEATHTGSKDGIFYKNESDIRDGSSSQYCIPISASLILRRDEMPSLGN
jgi:hypothetical protein